MHRCLLGAALLLSAPAGAQTLDDLLGPETLLPPASARVPYVPEAPIPENIDPDSLVRDPTRLAAFFRQDMARLDSERLTPDLARMLAGILLRGNETFLAETLLHNAAKRFPEDTEISRAWGRVLISLGRPEAARRILETVVGKAPDDPTAHYLLGRAYMGVDPQDPANRKKIAAAFETTLKLAPDYTDSDGVGAREIRAGLEQITRGRGGRTPAPGAGSSPE